MAASVLIVGAGIFGLTGAWALRRRGWEVTVLDPGAIPHRDAASTDVSKIIRMDYGADRLYTALGEAAMTGWDEWNDRWQPRLYHEDGFLLLAGEPMQPGGFEHESFATLTRRRHPVERLTPANRGTLAPMWDAGTYPDGYFNRRAGWAESARVVERVAGEARDAGVRIIEGCAFARLLERGGSIAGAATISGDHHGADVTLIAAGAWTPTLLPHLDDVMWTTGQPVFHVDTGADPQWRPPAFPVWAADIARTGWYGFPALPNGALKIGHHGTGRRVDPDAPRAVLPSEESQLREFLRANLPKLGEAAIVHRRLCLYCDTFDGDFWIDHDPDRPGLAVAAGDSGHGFKFAPALGDVIADAIERRPNPCLERFRWRARLRDRREAARADA